MTAPPSRIHDQNSTAQLAAQFNEFYLQITLPTVSQIGNYRIIEEIGEGAFGKVYLAQHLLLNAQVVLKCGLVDDPNIVREIYYHRQLKHKNIVKLYEVIKTETHLWMALEYCEGSELFYYIYEQRRLDLDVCKHLFYQIVEGIKYVHSLNLSHRDLKLENILLADKKQTIVKLTDFGFVREFNPYKRQFLQTMCGTTAYMAPEVLRNERYSGFAIDIWSLGVVLYAMLYGELPFDEDDDLKTKYKILHEEPSYRDTVAADTIALLQRMLSKDPAARPSLTEIFNSSFLIDITNQSLERRTASYNDAESIISINQHYKVNAVPFQTRIERDLLKKMEKLEIDTDFLQSSMHTGNTNSLTAFYELALAREFRKKKNRYIKKKRYYEAKRQLKKSRKRVKSALSLSEQNTGQPLEKIISTLSIGSLRYNENSTSKTNLSRKSIEDTRRYSARNSIAKRRSGLMVDSQIPHSPVLAVGSVAVPLERSVSFFPDDRKSTYSFQASESLKVKSKKFLGKLQFWKRTRRDARRGSVDTCDSEKVSNNRDSDDDVLEINMPHLTPSPVKCEKLVVEHQVDTDHLYKVPMVHPPELENGHRRKESENTIPSQSSTDAPHMQASLSQDSYYGARRARPASVVSQVSQYSQLSHLYPMSESELDILDGTDIDEDFFDDDGVYESSINTSQHDLLHHRPGVAASSSSMTNSKKKRPLNYRMPSDTLILSTSTSATGQRYPKKYLLSQVSSNSSDESSVRSKLIDTVHSDGGAAPPMRPNSPRMKLNGTRKSHPKLRGSRPGNSPKSSTGTPGVHTPSPVNPILIGGINRSHSPPISKKFSMNGVMKPMKMVIENGSIKEHMLPNFKYAPNANTFDTVQVDTRWNNGNGTGTPRLFEAAINEEEEEEDLQP